MFSLIDEIVETNKETLSSVYEKIKESGESIDFIFSVIGYSFMIRPLNTRPLLELRCMLSQTDINAFINFLREKQRYESVDMSDDRLYFMLLHEGMICEKYHYEKDIFQENKIARISEEDDIESFIKMSSEVGFDPKSKVLFYSSSPIGFNMYYDNSERSYLQIIAFYGAVKCFKHAYLTNEYDLSDVEEYAVAGGNLEIIHILEQRNVSFNNCLKISLKFHRNELSDWILMHYKCFEYIMEDFFSNVLTTGLLYLNS